MPFDETSRQPGRRPSRNVMGGVLDICSTKPMTGFFRNGCCDTSAEDFGSHTVCAVMTAEFLGVQQGRGQRPIDAASRIRLLGPATWRSLVPVRPALARSAGRGRRTARRAARHTGGRVGALQPGRPEEIRCRPGLRGGQRTSRGIRADRPAFSAACRTGRAQPPGRCRGTGAAARPRTGADLRRHGRRCPLFA